MNLYNIVFTNTFEGETYSFRAVNETMDYEIAHKLAIDYMNKEVLGAIDEVDPKDIQIDEYELIDNVGGYKVKLVKE